MHECRPNSHCGQDVERFREVTVDVKAHVFGTRSTELQQTPVPLRQSRNHGSVHSDGSVHEKLINASFARLCTKMLTSRFADCGDLYQSLPKLDFVQKSLKSAPKKFRLRRLLPERAQGVK